MSTEDNLHFYSYLNKVVQHTMFNSQEIHIIRSGNVGKCLLAGAESLYNRSKEDGTIYAHVINIAFFHFKRKYLLPYPSDPQHLQLLHHRHCRRHRRHRQHNPKYREMQKNAFFILKYDNVFIFIIFVFPSSCTYSRCCCEITS